MPGSMNKYDAEFVPKILLAASQEEVKKLIDDALSRQNQNPEKIAHTAAFIDAMIAHLLTLNPMNKDARQWSNINMARIHFQHIKRNKELTAFNKP